MSGLPIMGVARMEKKTNNRWAVYNLITQILNQALSWIHFPNDIEVLLMIHPKGISEETQNIISQFVAKGGKLSFYRPAS